MAAGCIPVVNDGPNNRLVSSNPYLVFARPTPRGIADALAGVVARTDLPDHARQAAESAERLSWDESGKQLEKIMLRVLASNVPD
jgi:hypothetical protein